jgi:hypothetical protein
MPIVYKDKGSSGRITYKAKQDSPEMGGDNSIYAKGGEWDMRKKFGRFGTGSKFMGLPTKELALTSSIPPAAIYELITKEPAEDLLPAVGQAIGGAIKTVNPLAGVAAPVAGATAGQVVRQGIKSARGMKPDLSMIPKEAAATAGTELLFRGLPRVPFLGFNKQLGGKAREEAGRRIGEIASKVEAKAPFIRFSKNDIIQRIDDQIAKVPFESGPQRQALMKIRNKLSAIKKPLTFDEMRQLEQQMGREAAYAQEATQGHFLSPAKGPKAPKSDLILKGERARVSGRVDEAAARAGFPEFEKESLKYSNLMKKYPEKDLQRGGWVRNAATIALAGGGAMTPSFGDRNGLNPALGTALLMASLSPRAKTAIFRKIVDTPAGRGVGRSLTHGASELARRAIEGE